jgi:hypothetical protein
MRSVFSKSSLVFSAALASLLAFSCSSDQNRGSEETGKVGMAIKIPAAAGNISSVNWTISGNNVNRTDTISVGNSQTASAQIGGIPVGTGYTLSLSAKSDDNKISCSGSASFNITASSVTKITLNLTCNIVGPVTPTSSTTGAVAFTATEVDNVIPGDKCAVIDSISASPAEVVVGHDVALSASGHDPDSQPSALAYKWSGSNGFSATGANVTFPCTQVGTVTITLTISDGVADCDTYSTNSETKIVCSDPSGGAAGAAGSSNTAAAGSSAAAGTTSAAGGTTSTAGGASSSSSTTRNAQSIVTQYRGADCWSCAVEKCAYPDSFSIDVFGTQSCAALAGQMPTVGSAVGSGKDKNALCLDTLECILSHTATNGGNCVQSKSVQKCFCGTAVGTACLSAPTGVCLALEAAALEIPVTTPMDYTLGATNFEDVTRGAGPANAMVRCMANGDVKGCQTICGL